MIKSVLLWLLGAVLLTIASVAEAQQPGKILRIGFLDLSTAAGIEVLLHAFRQELLQTWLD